MGWLRARRCIPAIAALVLAASAVGAPKPTPPSAGGNPRLATALPFTLTDSLGQQRTLKSFRGKPVALFFYCGCTWCHKCARLWGQMQKGGALDSTHSTTLVVFQGDAAMSKAFLSETGLDPTRTVVLPDPSLDTTLKYHAETCPRIFILDPAGKIRYTNNHADDAPRKGPETLIIGNTVSALQQAAPKPR